MAVLLFTLSPAAVGQLHDLLTCLARFDETIAWEASPEGVRPLFQEAHEDLTILVVSIKSQHIKDSTLCILSGQCFLYQIPLLLRREDQFGW
jgi:hypothetical protein